MVYKELSKKDFLEFVGFPERKIPELLIIDGNYRFEERLKRFESLVKKRFKAKEPFFNQFCRFGFFQKVPVAFSCVYGPALASEIVHTFCLLGTKAVIQIGSFGGLQKRMKNGDLLVPTWAGKGDGASKYYLHQGKADSTLALREQLANVSVAKGFRVFKKPIFSTSAILAETKGMIRNWSKKGFFGVDLETAATFAIAKHFGVACAGLLFLSDNVIEDQHVLMELAFEDKKRKIKAKESILPLALQSGIEFVKGV